MIYIIGDTHDDFSRFLIEKKYQKNLYNLDLYKKLIYN